MEDLRVWGATQQQIDEWRTILRSRAKEQGVDVWPEHWHAVQLFLAMGTQWRIAVGPMGQVLRLGLDYAALDACDRIARPHVPRDLRRHRRGQRAELIDQLRTLEAQAIQAWNEAG